MSYADEQVFHDVTPHRIEVTSLGKINDYGRQEVDPATKRTYRCLVSTGQSITKAAQGVTVTEGINAWTLATPLEKSVPVRILDSDVIHFVSPSDLQDRPLAGVTCYYAEDGSLNNMLVRFT